MSPRIIDGRFSGMQMGSLEVPTRNIADDAITQAKIADAAVGTAQIIDGDVADADLDSLFQMGRDVSIGTAAAYVSFGTAYGDTPVVVTAPGPGVTYARVTAVTPGSFEWAADAAGSANWMAWGHR